MRTALTALALAGMMTAAWGHSFYPPECCSEVDCFPVPVPRSEVQATPDGWFLIKERVTVPYGDARPSPDGRFHICRNELGKGNLITPTGKKPCLWAPEGAS